MFRFILFIGLCTFSNACMGDIFNCTHFIETRECTDWKPSKLLAPSCIEYDDFGNCKLWNHLYVTACKTDKVPQNHITCPIEMQNNIRFLETQDCISRSLWLLCVLGIFGLGFCILLLIGVKQNEHLHILKQKIQSLTEKQKKT